MFKQPNGFYRQLAMIAIPTSLQSLLFAGLGVADTMMVGGLGENAIAAVGLGTKLHFVFLLLILGFANACSILVAQYYGARQLHRIKEALFLTIATTSFVMLLPTLLFAIQPSVWLSLVVSEPDLLSMTATFLQITAPLMLFTGVIVSTEHALRAMGDTMLMLLVGAAAVLLNILLNYLLIFGNGGFPEMGVAGAALGTTISRGLQLLVLLAIVQTKRPLLAYRRGDAKQRIDRLALKRYWRFAVPIALNFGLWGMGSTLYHIIASKAGEVPLAVLSMLAPIESMWVSLFVGVSSAAAVLLGRELGQNHTERAWQLKTLFVNGAAILAVIVGAVLWIAGDWILSPYKELDAVTWGSLNQTYVVMCAIAWLKVHNMMSVVAVLRSGGDNDWCLRMDIVCMWLVSLPLTAYLALVLKLPYHWVYMAMFSEELIKLFASRWRIQQRQWMNNLTTTLG